ncbi:MAG: hypothetical protein Q8N77_02400 [Nanoarchaeota archaeon]|nr:hypothetical protein [Nanoarchaeota archaeon]
MKIKLEDIIKTALVLFAVYIIYQVLRKILGGGWSIEQIILSLLILNIGWTALLQRQLSSHIGEHKGYRLGRLDAEKEK